MDSVEKVNSFFSFFQKKIENIKGLPIAREDNFMKKQLYVAIIDTLGKTISLPKNRNRERFVGVIEKFSNWSESNKISLPHIIRFLERIPEPKFDKLREFVEKEHLCWKIRDTIKIGQDPDFEKVSKLWPKEFLKIGDISLESFQHKNLFYKFRNSLIHEFRAPGYGIEFDKEESPFYHAVKLLSSQSVTWSLVYPVGFFEKILVHLLINLERHFLKTKIDPRINFKFGSYWIEEFV